MKVSLRIAEFLRPDSFTGRELRRGLIAEMAKSTGIDRHTVAALLANKAQNISLAALGRISDYLIKHHGADPAALPSGLLRRDPEHFWSMLASCQKIDFCLGARKAMEWQGADYVMSSDARLQGRMLSKVSTFVTSAKAQRPSSEKPEAAEAGARVQYPGFQFHLVPAPGRKVTYENPGSDWANVRKKAEQLYARIEANTAYACLALGSVKVNPLAEMMYARAFSAQPFVNEDSVEDPSDRHCPAVCIFRTTDPRPPSCAGGLRLAAKMSVEEPGFYFEKEDGQWEACVWDRDLCDAAIFFYAYYPNLAHVDVACGGFSFRATNCLTKDLEWIVSQAGEPQYISDRIQLGLYVIRFTFDRTSTDYDEYHDNRPFETEVIPVPKAVLQRRLERVAESSQKGAGQL